MYALQDQLGDKDKDRTRVFTLENGTKLIAKQTDPYGFWRLHLEKGQLPQWLDQDFNEWGQVIKHVERYIKYREETIAEAQKEDLRKRVAEAKKEK